MKYATRYVGDPENARVINRSIILNYFRKEGVSCRVSLSKSIGLSKMTVSSIVANLIEDNLVVEVGEGKSFKQGGRKPILLELNVKDKFILGIDIGTKNLVAGVGNLKGEIIYKKSVPTTRNKCPDKVIEQIEILLESIMDESNIKNNKVIGIGLSIGGIIDKSKGVVCFSPDFNWRNIELKKIIEEKFKIPTVLDNCTRVMTLGEQWYGCAKNYKNIFYINIGHGIGSALVINGEIYSGNSEFGHIPITDKPIRCECGKIGCLEAVSSGNAIERYGNELIVDETEEHWISARNLAEMANEGNEIAKMIFSETGAYLGKAIAIAANMFNPEAIIIGGGVSQAKELLYESLQGEYSEHVIEIIKETTAIKFSSLGMTAGLYGALAYASNEFVFNKDIV